MGAKKSKELKLKSNELSEFQKMTYFSNESLISLYDYYRHFSSVEIDDGVIDFSEFCMIIKKNDNILTKRIFDTMDVNLDGSINFREFIKFLSVFINGTIEEQINLSYKIFSNRETKVIEAKTMCEILRDVIASEESLMNFLDPDLIDFIVKETFGRIGLSSEEYIDLEKYTIMVEQCPGILSWLRIDLKKIKKENFGKKLKKIGCFN
jgi:Ca2+-binding EF-hand superfamily protein